MKPDTPLGTTAKSGQMSAKRFHQIVWQEIYISSRRAHLALLRSALAFLRGASCPIKCRGCVSNTYLIANAKNFRQALFKKLVQKTFLQVLQ